MSFVQVALRSRSTVAVAATALAGTLLTGLPAGAGTPTTVTPATSATVSPTSGTLVAPTSDVRVTGGVGLTDAAVYAETATGIVTIPRDGSATDWTPVTVGGAPLTGHLLQAEADVLLVADADGTTDTLAWRTTASDTTASDTTGTGWTTRTVPSGTTLGGGGLFAFQPAPAPDGYTRGDTVVQIVEVRTASVAKTLGTSDTSGYALDATTFWYETVGDFALVETDLRTGRATRHGTHSRLQLAPFTVHGRWALLAGDSTTVHDVSDVYLTSTPALHDAALGADAVVGLLPAVGGTSTVVAQELGGDQTTRSYGPAAATAPDVDDRGTAAAYVDPSGDVRVIDLTWVAAPAAAIVDQAAPRYVVAQADHPQMSSPTITVRGAAGVPDPGTAPYRASGIAGYDLRYHQRRITTTTFGSWTVKQDTDELTVTVPTETQTCFEARARDHAGNLSAWSSATCVYRDATAPTVRIRKAVPPATKVVDGAAKVTIGYDSTQATGMARLRGYDVRHKVAPKGSTTYGAWRYPASSQNTLAVTRSVTITTGQRLCFSVRATDLAGNVGAWSPAQCTVADATAPRLTHVTPPTRWRGVPASGKVSSTIRFAGVDDHGVRFDVQVRRATIDGALPAWTTLAAKTAARSASTTLRPGEEACYRVRAHDLAGHVSAWSRVYCTNVDAPATAKALHADHLTRVAGSTVAYLRWSHSGATVVAPGNKGIRLTFRTCPTCGQARVQAGMDFYATVSTYSKRPGWKTVTYHWQPTRSGAVYIYGRAVPAGQNPAYLRSWTLLR